MRVASLAFFLLLIPASACTNPGVVGDGKASCARASECPATAPHCDGETNLCYQCLEADDCGGASPACSDGACRCETDADCGDGLACDEGKCTVD